MTNGLIFYHDELYENTLNPLRSKDSEVEDVTRHLNRNDWLCVPYPTSLTNTTLLRAVIPFDAGIVPTCDNFIQCVISDITYENKLY